MQEKEDLRAYLADVPVIVRKLDGRIIFWTAGAQALYGFTSRQAIGAISHELLQTIFPEGRGAADECLRAFGAWSGRLQHRTADGRLIWVESLWRRRISAVTGEPIVIEVNTDVTQRVAAEQHRDMLVEELNHRVKNTLAVVQALARASFRGQAAQAVQRFEDRLAALSEANESLLRSDWRRSELSQVVERALNLLHIRDRVDVAGPAVWLAPSAVASYSLALHELATNALKYGALSAPEGRVEIRWSLAGAGERRLHLIWREHGGPPVRAPQGRGFGLRLLETLLAAELGAPVQLRFEPSGVVCEFDGEVQNQTEGEELGRAL